MDAGIYGEKAVRYELENSHILMFLLHDLYLEHNGLTAQIDYLIVTRKHQFILECKTYMAILKLPAGETLYEQYLMDVYKKRGRLLACYTEPETRNQVIKVDQLSEYIRCIDSDPKVESSSEKDMETLARFFLEMHKEQHVDYAVKFRNALGVAEKQPPSSELTQPQILELVSEKLPQILCPKCGSVMIKRKAAKGANAGKVFYGCSNYPRCRGIVNIEEAVV